MQPRVRKDLIVRCLPDETIVYDPRRSKAHCLNATAAVVFAHCDGTHSVPQLAQLVHERLQLPADEQFVTLALNKLHKAQLLEDACSPAGPKCSRRDMVKRLGIAVLVLPAVLTLTARGSPIHRSGKGGGTTNGGLTTGGPTNGGPTSG